MIRSLALALFLLGCLSLGIFYQFQELFLKPNWEIILWATDFDSVLVSWIAEWGYQSLFINSSWERFWNAHIFFPYKNTLAYSDCLLGFQLFYAPLRLLGIGQMESLYFGLIAVVTAGFICTFIALAKTTKLSFLEKVLFSYICHFNLSLLAFMGHYQLFGFHFFPAFIIFLIKSLQKGHLIVSNLLAALLLFILASTFAIYAAPMFLTVIIIWIIFNAKKLIYASKTLKRNETAFLFLSFIFAFILSYKFYFSKYFAMLKSTEITSIFEKISYSARIENLFVPENLHSLFYNVFPVKNGDWEQCYFPGIVISLTIIIGLFVWKPGFDAKMGVSGRFIKTLFFVVWILSTGPVYGEKFSIYNILCKIIPGLEGLRAPGRFGLLFGPLFAWFAIFLIRDLEKNIKNIKIKKIVLMVYFFVILFETRSRFQIFYWDFLSLNKYEKISSVINEDSVVFEYPSHGHDHINTLKKIMMQMHGVLRHKGKILVGYSGRTTKECQTAISISQEIERNRAFNKKIIEDLDQMGVSVILVNKNSSSSTITINKNLSTYKLAFEDCDWIIYKR